MVLVVSAVLLVIVAVLGYPAARAAARPSDGRLLTLADSCLFGTVVLVLLLRVLELAGIGAAVLGYVAATIGLVVLARRCGSLRLPAARQPSAWAYGAVVVCVLALGLRLRPHLMLAWTGDQGAYVMNALEYANGYPLATGFPKGFPLYLSVSAYLFGPGSVVDGLPLLGLLTVVGTMRLCSVLSLSPWIALLAGATMALHPSAIYLSVFPGSESLQAVLSLAWVVLIGLLLSRPPGRASSVLGPALSFAVMAALGFTRITAPILLLPVALLLLSTLAPRLRSYAGTVAGVLAGGTLGAGTGLVLSIVRSGAYTERQLEGILPAEAMRVIRDAGLLEVAWPYLLVLLLSVVALVLWSGRQVSRLPRPQETARSPVPAGLAVAALGSSLTLVLMEGPGEFYEALSRYGWPLVLLSLGSLLLAVLGSTFQALMVAVLAWSQFPFVFIHARQFDLPRVHEYYLYWDRYLYSEFLPMTIGLGACALMGAALLLSRGRRAFRALVPTLGVVLVATTLASKANVYGYVYSGTQLEGSLEINEDLAEVIDEDLPLLWGADSAEPAAPRIFGNTGHALGTPYARVHGADLREMRLRSPFAPDPVVSFSTVRELSCRTAEDVLVAELRTPSGVPAPQRWPGDQARVTLEGVVSGDIRWLRHLRPFGEWVEADLQIAVYRVAHDPALCLSGTGDAR